MPNRYYINESNHERRILKRYRDTGFQTMRSAGSKGLVDCIAWNSKEIVFICSRSRLWTRHEMEEVVSKMIFPPNSCLVFFEYTGNVDKATIYEPLNNSFSH